MTVAAGVAVTRLAEWESTAVGVVVLLVGLAGFAFYLAPRAWPYLALGVAGGMLVAGVVFLASGLFGLRLRREVTA